MLIDLSTNSSIAIQDSSSKFVERQRQVMLDKLQVSI